MTKNMCVFLFPYIQNTDFYRFDIILKGCKMKKKYRVFFVGTCTSKIYVLGFFLNINLFPLMKLFTCIKGKHVHLLDKIVAQNTGTCIFINVAKISK